MFRKPSRTIWFARPKINEIENHRKYVELSNVIRVRLGTLSGYGFAGYGCRIPVVNIIFFRKLNQAYVNIGLHSELADILSVVVRTVRGARLTGLTRLGSLVEAAATTKKTKKGISPRRPRLAALIKC